MAEIAYYAGVLPGGNEADGAIATAMSPQTGYGGWLAIKKKTIDKLAAKFDIKALEEILNEYSIAKSVRHLSNTQGNYLAACKSLDSLRNRIFEAAQAQVDQALDGKRPSSSARLEHPDSDTVRKGVQAYVNSRNITGKRGEDAVREQLDWYSKIYNSDGEPLLSGLYGESGPAAQVDNGRKPRTGTKKHIAAIKRTIEVTQDIVNYSAEVSVPSEAAAWADAFNYSDTVSSIIHFRFTGNPQMWPIKGFKIRSSRDVMALLIQLPMILYCSSENIFVGYVG
jgi:hypothetical protein